MDVVRGIVWTLDTWKLFGSPFKDFNSVSSALRVSAELLQPMLVKYATWHICGVIER